MLAGRACRRYAGSRRGALYVRLDVAVPTRARRRAARGCSRTSTGRSGPRRTSRSRRGRGLLRATEERAALSRCVASPSASPPRRQRSRPRRCSSAFPTASRSARRRRALELAVFTDEQGEAELARTFARRLGRTRRAGLGGSLEGVPPPGPRRRAVDRAAVDRAAARASPRSWSIPAAPSARARTRRPARASSCSRALERGSVLDAGCGSGVVSVAAARLGFAPGARPSTRTRSRSRSPPRPRARTASRSHVFRADVLRDELPATDVARREHRARAWSSSSCAARAAQRRRDLRLPRVDAAPGARGLEHVDRLELDGWAADVLAQTALSSPRWRRSPFAFSGARCRTRTRRPCASACSATDMTRSTGGRGRRRRQHLLRHARGRLEVAAGRVARCAHPRARVRHRVRREPRGGVRVGRAERRPWSRGRARTFPPPSPGTSARSPASRPTRGSSERARS